MNLSSIYNWLWSNLTIRKWVSEYNLVTFKGDLSAGLTVGVMLIPQSMAYAVLAGLPPIYGMYACLVPLMIYPLFGTSRHISISIVSIDMLIIAAGMSNITTTGSAEYISAAIMLTAFVGLLQIAMSVARLGFIVNLLSKPVIIGFTTAAPLIIAFSQFDYLTGIDLPHTQYIYITFWNLVQRWTHLHPAALILGISTIILLFFLHRFFPLWPKALVLVLASSLLVWYLGLQDRGVEIVEDIPAGLPFFSIPKFTLEMFRRLIPTAVTLALVQFMNVITLGRTYAGKHKYAINPNLEFAAVGIANFTGSFFQALPVSGSYSCSALNEQAGAQTPLANLFSAILIGLTLLFLTPLFYYLPMSVLAAIIIFSASSLININELGYLFKTKERDGYIALFTFIITLVLGIQEGILLGIAASLFGVLLRSSRPNVAILGHMEGSRHFRDIGRNTAAHQIEGILILRIDASFSFNNAEYFKDFIIENSEKVQRPVKAVIVDGGGINDLDTTAIEALYNVADSLQKMDVELHFTSLKGPIRDVMLRSGLARKLGGTHFHMTPHNAVKYILGKWAQRDGGSQKYEAYIKDID